MTLSKKPDTEQLTEEERDWLDSICDVATIKLLRIHDRLKARVAELERKPGPETTAALLMRESHALDRWRELAIAWAEQLRDLIPRIGLRALEGVPGEVRGLLEEPRRRERSTDPLNDQSFDGSCPTCGQRYLAGRVARAAELLRDAKDNYECESWDTSAIDAWLTPG